MKPCRTTVRAALIAAAGVALLAGCGDAGGLKSAGATPTAEGPQRLWPDLPAISAPPFDYGESDTARIPSVKVPDGDVRAVSPVKVVQADVAANPEQITGADGLYQKTADQIRACGTQPKSCPVLQPYYHDLTGDGKDELIVAIRMPGQQTAIRVYLPDKDAGLTRVMTYSDAIVGVELAGRDLITRAVSAGIPGYEYRTAWSWDERQRVILPTRDEIIRIKPTASAASSPTAPAPPPPRTPDPSVTPTAAPAPSVAPSPAPTSGATR
ncbi:hypothetical protein [Streptomyces sp. NPDC127084]|uniref:hypothetical protein n=1 Tax=Streptomyces sp. NPDC127084 TaxID=3347133 RepID=UPI0036608154